MVPDFAFPMVDVRDVAKLHVQALMSKLILASGTNPISFADVAQFLINQGYKGPSNKIAPNWFFKFLSMFDREAKGMLALLGINMTADNSDTIKTFTWTPIPFEKTVIETANSIKMIQTK